MKNPKVKVWVLTGITTIIIGLALFLAAGTIDYWQGWMYLAINAATGLPLVLLFTKNPILLENRTKLGPAAEQRTAQKVIITLTGIPLIATFVVPALDYLWLAEMSSAESCIDSFLVQARTLSLHFDQSAFG